jgi:Kdo2-lipid IVA lauroyltransferase/acyltransferase
MGAIGYYIFYGINWVLTLLPLRVLYLFADIIYVILYYFPSYRRNIVATNLKNAFPEKTSKELKSIEKKFYKHFADIFVEIFKLGHMSNAQLTRRFKVNNLELIDRLYSEKRDIAAILGHYNNWEWLTFFPLYTKYKTMSIYKPLQNKFFDKFVNDTRSRNGMGLTPMSNIIREIITDRKNGVNIIAAFLSDQTPVVSDIRYWTTFLNQDTPVYLGAEKIASKYDMAVLFFNIQKVKRGYYSLYIELLFEHSAGLPEHQITESHVRRLEEIIKEKPEYWLWSHRRWKHKRPHEND